MFGRSAPSFDRLIEKATSQLLLEPDWDSILQLCDTIRQNDVPTKTALITIKKKISNENPHVTMFALQVLESVVKNCGAAICTEVATKEFMEYLKDLVKVRPDPVKTKILELVQAWSHAFRNEPSYKVVQDTFHLMKMEGYTFPSLKEADAMFVAEKAPEWRDSEVCSRCRVQFTVLQRKHHCRNCGEVFCHKCSSKNSIIPKFGIEREVRVCEACHESLNKSLGLTKKSEDDDLPAEYLASPLSKQAQLPSARSEAEIQEEEELQLALALSKSEADTKGKDRERLRTNFTSSNGRSSSPATTTYAEPSHTMAAPVLDTSDMDPELARYLNRNYWEQKVDDQKMPQAMLTTTPSAPTVVSTDPKITQVKVTETYQNGEVDEEQQFLNALRSSIEIFVNRMRSNSQRGRNIANDSSVQTLFMTLNSMHPQLLKYINAQEESRAHYEGLQDKLAQIRDAREALNALRDEHREKRRREQEEMERQRQIQMAHKLEIMRQKKQEYLEYQRQLALQRMQEQEREMAMRLEQQKHMQHMKTMHGYAPYQPMYGMPQGAPVAGQTFSPAGSVDGSPLHHPHMQMTGASGPPSYIPQPMAGPPPQPAGPMAGQPMPPPNSVGVAPAPPHGALPPGTAAAPSYTSQPPGVSMSSQPAGTMAMTTGTIAPTPGGAPLQGVYAAPGQPGQHPGYQPPPGGYQPSSGSFQQVGPPPPQGYTGAMDYAAFNMQGMTNALPGQPPMSGQPGPYMGGPPPAGQPHYMVPPPAGQVPPPGTMVPPTAGQGPPPGGMLPPPVAPHEQPTHEAELICFD